MSSSYSYQKDYNIHIMYSCTSKIRKLEERKTANCHHKYLRWLSHTTIYSYQYRSRISSMSLATGFSIKLKNCRTLPKTVEGEIVFESGGAAWIRHLWFTNSASFKSCLVDVGQFLDLFERLVIMYWGLKHSKRSRWWYPKGSACI